MANQEQQPHKITIPGRLEAVAKLRIRGPVGRIEHEYTGKENYPLTEEVAQALGRGERVFRIRDDGLMFVSAEAPRPEPLRATGTLIGFSVEDLDTVDIPGKPIEVNLNQAEGDTRSGIRFEVRESDAWADKLDEAENIRSAFADGARVFITENDDLLFVRPPFEENRS